MRPLNLKIRNGNGIWPHSARGIENDQIEHPALFSSQDPNRFPAADGDHQVEELVSSQITDGKPTRPIG